MSKHYEKQKRINGQFATANPEPADAKLTFRVTPSLRREIEQVAGDRVGDWLRQAVIEKLNKELDNELESA